MRRFACAILASVFLIAVGSGQEIKELHTKYEYHIPMRECELWPEHFKHPEAIVDRAEELGMMVILGIFLLWARSKVERRKRRCPCTESRLRLDRSEE